MVGKLNYRKMYSFHLIKSPSTVLKLYISMKAQIECTNSSVTWYLLTKIVNVRYFSTC